VGGSLYRANKEVFTPYAFAGAPPNFNWIFNLAPGRDGAFWVASERGIFCVKDGTFQHWSTPEGLPESITYTIMMDSDGTVWASTLSGVVRLKDNKISVIRRKDGLFDDNIYAIVPDDLGNFWIDSGRGIYRVSRQAMNDFADGRIGRVESLAFDGPDSVTTVDKDQKSGTRWLQIVGRSNLVSERQRCRDHRSRAHSDQSSSSRGPPRSRPRQRCGRGSHQPRRRLSRPGRAGSPFHDAQLRRTPTGENPLSARRVRQGLDRNGKSPGAFYTNLRPGHYLFRVTAANGDGVWNTNGPSLAIVLQPYFLSDRMVHRSGNGRSGWPGRRDLQLADHRAALAKRAIGTPDCRTHGRAGQVLRRAQASQTVLLETSRLAGIAEMATGVLHNLGNALNA